MVNVRDIREGKVAEASEIPWDDAEIIYTTDVAEQADRQGLPEDRVPDLLATIFAGQKRLMERYEAIERANGVVVVPPERWGDIDARDVQVRIKDLAYRTIEEIAEAMGCLKNRPWKSSFVETDRDHFEEELADALHFLVELFITAGMDANKVFERYYEKHAVNQFRQASNY